MTARIFTQKWSWNPYFGILHQVDCYAWFLTCRYHEVGQDRACQVLGHEAFATRYQLRNAKEDFSIGCFDILLFDMV